MTNNDENVVRTRLLLDGDGTGDDRRLNNISKMVRSVQQQIKFLIIKSIRKLSSPPVSNTYLKGLKTKLCRGSTLSKASRPAQEVNYCQIYQN